MASSSPKTTSGKKKRIPIAVVRKRYNRRQKVIGIGIIFMALAIFSVSILIFYPAAHNYFREKRINAIYSSLNLSDVSKDYIAPVRENIFGERRVYEWDKSRTYSSEVEYVRAADVATTAAELDKAIKKAGYTYFEERYPGSLLKTPTYKSKNGEYIRVTVSSKTRDDALWNQMTMTDGVTDEFRNLDPNAGPSNVQIKVNLDDNNE
jgi:hypothetical protein